MITRLRQKELMARNLRLPLAKPQVLKLSEKKTQKNNLKVVYVMTHVSICGGVKIIFEHANRLMEQGWEVVIISHFPKPDWYPIHVEYKQVPFGLELAQGIPICDIIVATYWDHIQSCIETGIAPVIYFEQGDEHLFHLERLSDEMQAFVKTQMQLPQFIMTVSHQAASLLREIFGRESVVIPNAIDHSIFKVMEKDNSLKEQYILMMGNETVSFKGIPQIIRAFEIVKGTYPEIKLYWINPKNPGESWMNTADQLFINPPQVKIAELFRRALLFVSASEFESFSLPALEAMATGCPVVSTKNFGVMEYGVDGENIIFSEIGNENDLVEKILFLLENNELRERISNKGLVTAAEYNWKNTISKLNEFLVDVSKYDIVSHQKAEDWKLGFEEINFLNTTESQRFKKSLESVPDDIIYVPVIYDWIISHPIVRWEIAATRMVKTPKSSTRVFAPVIGRIGDMRQVLLGEGIQFVMEERYNEALNYFISQYSTLSDEWKTSCSKWIIICLIELNRDNDALNVIRDVLQINKEFSDVYYLYHLLLRLNNSDEVNEISQVIDLIGDSLQENECFYDLGAQLRK